MNSSGGARRTSLVTGANTGIGRVTATELARRGDRVILACRSEATTRPVIREIVAETGNEAVEFLLLDLGDLKSARRAADSLNERGNPIDVLVANAGLAGQRGQTRQGFELAFGTNHMGHFAFVTGVLDLLRAGTDSRLVVVSSDAHYDAKGIDLGRVRGRTRTVTGLREYAVSKLANVLFAQEVARRVPADELWVGAVHPGVIATDVWRGVPRPVRPALRKVLKMKPPAEGATTSLTCATSDLWADRRGGYFSVNEPKDPSPVATPELAARLWDYSQEWLTGA